MTVISQQALAALLTLASFLCAESILAQYAFPDPNPPFVYGVASGDPLQDSILLWIAIDPSFVGNDTGVNWALWVESGSGSFTSPLQSGSLALEAGTDYTGVVEVTGLDAGVRYGYQFEHSATGNRSVVGSTKTLPNDASLANNSQVNLGVISCASSMSGYLHAYTNMANMQDLDVIVHLGDYIYNGISDKVKDCGLVPKGINRDGWWGGKYCKSVSTADPSENEDPYIAGLAAEFSASSSDLEIYRWIHKYYHMNPYFRAARAAHPWIVLYDNHDTSTTSPLYEDGLRAFVEWVPMRVQIDSNSSVDSFRHFEFGSNFIDLITLDTRTKRVKSPQSTLGPEQEAQFMQAINASGSKGSQWRIIANPKQFTPSMLNHIPEFYNAVLASTLVGLVTLSSACFAASLWIVKKRGLEESVDAKPEKTTGEDVSHYLLEVDAKGVSHGTSGSGVGKSGRCNAMCMPIREGPRPLGFCFGCGVVSVVVVMLIWIGAAAVWDLVIARTGSSSGNSVLYLNSKGDWTGRGYESQVRMFSQLEQSGVASNNVWITGDMHYTVVADAVAYDRQNADSLRTYDREAAASKTNKRYGVEFLPAGGTSPNVDENIFGALGFETGTFLNSLMSGIVEYLIREGNPHMKYFDGNQHGHGVLRVSPIGVTGELWYADVLNPNVQAKLFKRFLAEDGENRWVTT